MRTKVRILVTILFCLTLLVVPVSANDTGVLVTDVVDIENHWAVKQMTHLVAMGVVKGYPKTIYSAEQGGNIAVKELRPDKKITRAEFAVMMGEALNFNKAEQAAPFKDAGKIPSWAKQAVNTLYHEKIMMGNTEGYVKPNNYITRAELAAMVVQGLNDRTEVQQPREFPDVPKNYWARTAIQKAADLGIITGRTDGRFAPTSYATRGEVMTMLFNMMNNDKLNPPNNSDLLAVTDAYMTNNKEILNGPAPYEFSSLTSLLTGSEAAGISVTTEMMNKLAEDQEVTYEVLTTGVVKNKSDRLAQVSYDTRLTYKNKTTGQEVVYNLTEHIYLMKIQGKWLIYYVPSDQRNS